jgi:dienelactone hydrolase
MKAVRILLVVLALLAVGLVIAWLRTAPEGLPVGTESAVRLEPGPHPVGHVELEWVDASRPTAENGDFPGAPTRTFPVALWYPEGQGGPHPLVVYSHGFMSQRHGGSYLADHLASHGYVVVSTDYPLTNMGAPGGANFLDVVHQPADVSFLIDRVMGLDGAGKPFEGEIDPERIGVFGLSLGGLTTTLVAFHPEWRDPRIAAAISIAGPGNMFGPDYFDHAEVPFLMIAGTSDAMVDYELNAAPIPSRVRDGGLVTIAMATHTGFSSMAAGVMRLLGNPDTIGCRVVMANFDDGDAAPGTGENPFDGLFGTPEQGLLDVSEAPAPCAETFEEGMAAGRPQMLTTLAVVAFFESQFALDPAERATHAAFLATTLPREVAEVAWAPAER